MKKLFLFLLIISMQSAFADYYNTFETKSQAYDRRSYENYQTYQNNNYQAPLGGYNRPINDNGGKQFGMTGNSNNGLSGSGYSNSFSGNNRNSWNQF